ncbi:MAG: ParA family protein [Pirellulales bacterium]|nr:ParA family protein [Pirellulales bacterium]
MAIGLTTVNNGERLATTICMINQKGGCGKSSTCFHLAGHFSQQGLEVLLVDADPQGSLSQGFFGSQFVETLKPHQTLASAFLTSATTAGSCSPIKTSIERVELVPANQHLARFNVPEPEMQGLAQYRLDSLLAGLPDYDVVLIDCPPNLFACSWNALLAADYVLVPVPPEDFGTQGLRAVHQAITSAQILNPKLKLLGHVVTRYDGRLLVHRAYEQKLRKLYVGQVLTTIIPEASAFKVALSCRQPVTHSSPRSKAALMTAELGHELIRRRDETERDQRVA